MTKKCFRKTLDLFWHRKIFWGVGRTPDPFSTIRKFCCSSLGKAPQWVSPRYLTSSEGPRVQKSRKMPKSICTHQAHPFWDFSLFCFQVHKKTTFWRKVLRFCALWVQILVWGAPNCFSRKVWSEKMILHTLDTFQWSKLMPTQLFELGYFSRFLRVLRQYFL